MTTPKLTPEAVALIREGTPKPQTQILPPAQTVATQAPSVAKPEREAVEPAKPKIQREREPQVVSYVAMTVRVPQPIPTALLKASSDRKLKKIDPYTQQAIVTEALQKWLRDNGYLSKEG